MKTMRFRQCELRKRNSVQVAWIPERFAVVGRKLKLRALENWDEGWQVAALFAFAEEGRIPNSHNCIRNHRLSTGDALPRRTAR